MSIKAVPPPMWLIALTISSSVVGMTLLTPALPLIQQELNVSGTAVQSLLTAYLATIALGQLVYGTVSDLIGRRPVLLFGAVLYFIGGAAALLSDTIEWLTFYRVIQGLGAAACLSMGRAIVNDCFDRTEAAKNMSTIQMLQAIVPGLSLALGGVIAELMGWRGAMVIMSFMGLAVLFLAIYRVTETNLNPVEKINLNAVTTAYKSVLKNRTFFFFSTAGAMQVGMFFSLNAFLPYQYARLGFSAMEFGLMFSLTPFFYLIGNSLNKHFFIRRGIEKTARAGCFFSMISVILLGATQYMEMTHALSLVVPCCLFGFSNGMVVANTTIGAISSAGRHAGTGTGLAGALQMAVSGISGATIIALGGDQHFLLSVSMLVSMAVISIFSMNWVYQNRPIDSDTV